ncbi:MAG: tRNA lysidine(34) synthetase TilS [Lachnospiraceae bacterium]|nr:tRNA lysidine(34) synthetase TilS [Lachnospiraceae bacterium]
MKTSDKVIKNIKDKGLVEKYDTVVVGVSGGADSLFLLKCLEKIQSEMCLNLVVVHVNHGLRGEDADRDEKFVSSYSKKHSLRFFSFKENVSELADKNGLSEEEAGRNYRISCFRKVLKEVAKTEEAKYTQDTNYKLALAHHMDDQVETVIFQMLRGSSLKGLTGMKELSDFQDVKVGEKGEKTVVLIRPLLCVRKNEILSELKDSGTEWCEDVTNSETEHSRNKLRNDVIPYLEKEIQKETVGHIAEMSKDLAEIDDYLEIHTTNEFNRLVKLSDDKAGIDVEGFSSLHPAIKKCVAIRVISAVAGARKNLTKNHIQMFLRLSEGETGKKIILPGRVVCERVYDNIFVYKKRGNKGNNITAVQSAFSEEVSEEVIFDKGELVKKKSILMDISFNVLKAHRVDSTAIDRMKKTSCIKYFDCDKISDALVLRYPKEGDYILLSRGMEKKLSRIMIDLKIPREDRKNLLVLASGSHVVWIPELNRVSAGAYVDEKTKRIIIAEIGDIA